MTLLRGTRQEGYFVENVVAQELGAQFPLQVPMARSVDNNSQMKQI